MTQTAPSVLVVEDEALLLMTIADELRDAGFEVFEAINADAAIALLHAHSHIRILFTDIDMPGSMDGLRLSTAVRDRWPPVEIIVTSGKNRPDARSIPERGIFMPKPYATAEVVTAIHRLMQITRPL